MKCRRIRRREPSEGANSDPQSEDTWSGMPCFENTCEWNAPATPGAVIVSVVGMKVHYLDTQPITTRIGETVRRSTNSILIEYHGGTRTGKGCSKP